MLVWAFIYILYIHKLIQRGEQGGYGPPEKYKSYQASIQF